MGNSANRDIRTIDKRKQEYEALELRKRGYTYRQIATALALSVGAAHKLIQGAIDRIPAESATEVRTLELERIDRMLSGLWTAASRGDPKSVLATVRLMDRRAKYLGLDAAQQVELSGAVETRSPHDELLSKLARRVASIAAGSSDPEPDAGGSGATPL